MRPFSCSTIYDYHSSMCMLDFEHITTAHYMNACISYIVTVPVCDVVSRILCCISCSALHHIMYWSSLYFVT